MQDRQLLPGNASEYGKVVLKTNGGPETDDENPAKALKAPEQQKLRNPKKAITEPSPSALRGEERERPRDNLRDIQKPKNAPEPQQTFAARG